MKNYILNIYSKNIRINDDSFEEKYLIKMNNKFKVVVFIENR